MISLEEIEALADLCKLSLSQKEKEGLLEDFSKILDLADKLNKVNLEDVEPLYQVFDYSQVLREDIVKDSLPREELLKNTVEKQYGYFKLLNIME